MVKILLALAHNNKTISVEIFNNILELQKYTKQFHEADLIVCDIWDVAGMRNMGAEAAIKGNYDYVFFLDSDMLYPKESIVRLITHNKEIIGGFYMKRQPPLCSTQFKDFDKRNYGLFNPATPNEGVIPVAATGFGGVLVKTTVFGKLEKPYFNMIHLETGEIFGEDTYFCRKVWEAGMEVYSDTDLIYGHQINAFIYPFRIDIR